MTRRRKTQRDAAAAAYGLALRVTGDERRATEAVEAALDAGETDEAGLIARVRAEARARRSGPSDAGPVPRPAALAGVEHRDWAVLERVALRGRTLTEAAAETGLDRAEALGRLHAGMLAARERLRVEPGQRRHDAGASWLERLRRDLTAGGLDDAARDREAEARAAALLAG